MKNKSSSANEGHGHIDFVVTPRIQNTSNDDDFQVLMNNLAVAGLNAELNFKSTYIPKLFNIYFRYRYFNIVAGFQKLKTYKRISQISYLLISHTSVCSNVEDNTVNIFCFLSTRLLAFLMKNLFEFQSILSINVDYRTRRFYHR